MGSWFSLQKGSVDGMGIIWRFDVYYIRFVGGKITDTFIQAGAFVGLSTKSLETLGVTSVRPFVRPLVTRFLVNRSLLFSETILLVFLKLYS